MGFPVLAAALGAGVSAAAGGGIALLQDKAHRDATEFNHQVHLKQGVDAYRAAGLPEAMMHMGLPIYPQYTKTYLGHGQWSVPSMFHPSSFSKRSNTAFLHGAAVPSTSKLPVQKSYDPWAKSRKPAVPSIDAKLAVDAQKAKETVLKEDKHSGTKIVQDADGNPSLVIPNPQHTPPAKPSDITTPVRPPPSSWNEHKIEIPTFTEIGHYDVENPFPWTTQHESLYQRFKKGSDYVYQDPAALHEYNRLALLRNKMQIGKLGVRGQFTKVG
jgi:hypothetical protein